MPNTEVVAKNTKMSGGEQMLFDLGRLRIEFIGLEDWDVKITKNPNNQDELTLEASRKTPASFKAQVPQSFLSKPAKPLLV